jgi:hypothetical protein
VNKLRWGKFFWSDWSDDPALASCGLAAQGLWMRLLCIAAQGTPYGHVTVNGRAPSMDTLQKLIRPKPKRAQLERLIAELERNGVVERAPDGCFVSRRMVRDGHVAMVRRDAVNQRTDMPGKYANRSPNGVQKESERSPCNDSVNVRKAAENGHSGQDLYVQKNGFVAAESDTQSTESPLTPREAGGTPTGMIIGEVGKGSPRARGTNPRAFDPPRPPRVRNGFLQTIIDDMELKSDDRPSPGGAEVVPISRRVISG